MAAMAALAARAGAAPGLRRRSATPQEPANWSQCTSQLTVTQLGGSSCSSLPSERRTQQQQLVAMGLSSLGSRGVLFPWHFPGSERRNDMGKRTHTLVAPLAALKERQRAGPSVAGGPSGATSRGEIRTEVIRCAAPATALLACVSELRQAGAGRLHPQLWSASLSAPNEGCKASV